ncbi:MAG: FKBP-type peptidyl-prolyl cis-trans isomerase [Tannerella sp.]|jgi:peptidylprolyl isomerase/FKBP-type peptidyl-prolyl cis-trans isomerase FklB|nr:FKBP-type peptidyl-prolyl cis-trans isomerase [Tannerella sp.]
MKKINFRAILLPIAVLCAVACGDDADEHVALAEWKAANEKALNEIALNPEYTELKSPGNNGSIYYRVLKKGDGQKPIYYTSRVEVYYKGWYAATDREVGITKGQVFDQKLFDDGAPAVFAVSIAGSTYNSAYSTYSPAIPIEGWTVALQYMRKGDKWEIWLPRQFAYGDAGQKDSNGNVVIPGYSTLVFEIEVISVAGIDGDTE